MWYNPDKIFFRQVINMDYIQQTDCKAWQFSEIPEFSCGIRSPLFMDCGTGLSRIPDFKSKDNSFMHFFREVKAEDITAYAALLEADGFVKTYEKDFDGNLFYQFRVSEGLFYISFMKNGMARFILDRCRTAEAGKFGYSEHEKICPDTKLVQYSLHYGKMIKGITCDCGMNYIFRLRDNSLVIIDGGEVEQATDIAVDDYMKLLHELTQTANGEKMRISLWLCTHPHNDHCDFMAKLIRFHSDEMEIERIAFNFPNPKNTRHSISVSAMKQRLCGYYPDADYIKLHAGTQFSIANAEFDVIVSSEDAAGLEEEDPFPWTNSSSMIFRVNADGASTVFLADCSDDNGEVITDNYGSDVLDCDFLQVAHHGINKIYDVYEKINAKSVLLPQCLMNMETRFSEVYAHLCARYGEENIIFASDATDIFTLKDGSITSEKRVHVGTAYDKSDW